MEKATLKFKEVYLAFRQGEFEKALKLSQELYSSDFENSEVLLSVKSALYWKSKLENLKHLDGERRKVDFLTKEWNEYLTVYLKKDIKNFEKGVNAIKGYVFEYCLGVYQRMMEKNPYDVELLTKLGKTYKVVGFYEKAIKIFQDVLLIESDNSDAMAQIADCYALINEDKKAKVLFREAFFVNPRSIDLDLLESNMILNLIEIVKIEKKANEGELKEWVPVYGVISGVFNVKRELKISEVSQLKQVVYSLRNQLKEKNNRAIKDDLILPRLLNRYFWLLDHYFLVKEERSKIDEIFLYMKEMDSSVYNKYVN